MMKHTMTAVGKGLRTAMKRILPIAGGMLLMVFFPVKGNAFEQVGAEPKDFPYFDERGDFYFGVFHPYINAQLQLNARRGPGTFIDVENDLGLESGLVTFLGKAMYRIGKHAAFDLTFVDIRRSSTKTIDKTLEFGDRAFIANATVNAFVNTQYYLLAYRYSFVRNNFNEFGASIGFNVMNMSSGLSYATQFAGVNISTGGAASGSQDETFVAPVPLLGIYFSSQIFPKTFVRNTIQYMDVNAEGYNFKALNYLFNLDYDPWKNVGVGVGVYGNRMELSGSKTIEGRFIYSMVGTQFYIRVFY